jgi:tetratricopeptide (TPR) repeat protein
MKTHRPTVLPDLDAQSLAYHLHNDLPRRILHEISKPQHGPNSISFQGGEPDELVNLVVRRSLSSAYKNWLYKQDLALSNASTTSTGTYVDRRRWKSHSSQLRIGESWLGWNGEVDTRDMEHSLSPVWSPGRPISRASPNDKVEVVLLQIKLWVDWHLQQHQQIPGNNRHVESTPVKPVQRLPETSDDQGLWYKFYLAVVMLRRTEHKVGWILAHEGCQLAMYVLQNPSSSFLSNLYNHFGSHKWDGVESLRMHILHYLAEVTSLLLGARHPLTAILRYLATEGFIASVSEVALKLMLDVYKQALDAMHPDIIETERSLCKVFRRQKEFSTAAERVLTMLEHSERVNGRYHTNTRRCMRRLGHLYRYQERYVDAEQMYRDVVQVAPDSSANPGDLDDLTLCTVHDLVSIAFQAQHFETAESWARLAMAAVSEGRTMTPENRLVFALDLQRCLEAQGRLAEARDCKEQHSAISYIPPDDESCEEHALLTSISKDHFAWVLAESGHPYLLPDAY